MRFYNQPHAAFCGVDLNARTMYLHVLEDCGCTCFDKNLPARPDAFLNAIAPFATDSSSAANACSPGTGSPTSAKTSTSPSSWATTDRPQISSAARDA